MVSVSPMRLTERDQAMLGGDFGAAAQLTMSLLVEMADIQGAERLIDISSAHIDGCLYHGQAGLDFADQLVAGGAKVAVPTTLNVSSLDLLHPDRFTGAPHEAEASRAQMKAYEAMGCRPTWTCAPYQLAQRPGLGEQVAWGESNAIVFANSVLGARTERYGDFMDICCAVTGRAPDVGLHTDSGRKASIVVELEIDERLQDYEILYPLLGGVIGRLAGQDVVAIRGLVGDVSEDRLKALGAAAASTGSTAMFHVIGVTPEAPDLKSVAQDEFRLFRIDDTDLAEMFSRFDRDAGSVGAISVGTPHFSVAEFEALAGLVNGRRAVLPFAVNTGRDVLASLEGSPALRSVIEFGAQIVTDTCVYLTPILGDVDGLLMTNSGKAAFYAPGNLGVGVAFGSLEDCVETAVAGRLVRTGPWS